MQLELTPSPLTKQCPKCKSIAPLSGFYKDRGRPDGLFMWCKACANQSSAKNQQTEGYAERHRTYVYKAQKKIGDNCRFRVIAVKEFIGCALCSEREPACLDFHHVDPTTKSFTLSKSGKGDRTWEAVSREITKCVVLCANCHRKVHANIMSIDGIDPITSEQISYAMLSYTTTNTTTNSVDPGDGVDPVGRSGCQSDALSAR